MTIARVFSATLLTLAAPGSALACAVCGTMGMENNSGASFGMTIIMSLLPLCMMGGVVYWVSRRVAAAEAASMPHQVPAPSSVPTPYPASATSPDIA